MPVMDGVEAVDDFLTKPLRFDELAEALARASSVVGPGGGRAA
jgi:FixJ family two-component response regulator